MATDNSKGRRVEKWGNWERVKREEIPDRGLPEVDFKSRENSSPPNPLDTALLKKIDTKKKKQRTRAQIQPRHFPPE